MAILNYTTKIDADKTAMEIARCLSSNGAKALLTEYDEEDGYVKTLSFKISLDGKDVAFRLPCDWRPILDILEEDSGVPTRLCTREQAVRVAWRIVKVWVEAQMALIQTKMAKTEEVFLPYAVRQDGKTLFQSIQENPSLLLSNESTA